MADPRRPIVLSLILEWDPSTHTLPEHLGMTPEEFSDWKATGALSRDYRPREPVEAYEPEPLPRGPGRPPGRVVPPETKARIRELLIEGKPRGAIAGECGVSLNTILGVARKLRKET